MSDIIIRDASNEAAAILEVRAALSAMRKGDRHPVGTVGLVTFEDGSEFMVKRTSKAYIVTTHKGQTE